LQSTNQISQRFLSAKTNTFQAAQVLVCRVETALTAQRQAKLLRKYHTRPEETMRHPGFKAGGEAEKKKKNRP